MTDQERLQELFNNQQFMVIAVTLDDGSPWAVPVRVAAGDGREFEWDSMLSADHSIALDDGATMAITMYEKTDDRMTGFYATGWGELLEEKNETTGRYRFTVREAWINDETFQKRSVEMV